MNQTRWIRLFIRNEVRMSYHSFVNFYFDLARIRKELINYTCSQRIIWTNQYYSVCSEYLDFFCGYGKHINFLFVLGVKCKKLRVYEV